MINKYVCVKCGKKRQSIDKTKTICAKCLNWISPGIGQIPLIKIKEDENNTGKN
jgi:hypothetical protein